MAALSARRLKALLWVGLSAPLLWLLVLIGKELQQTNSGLGAEPSEALLHYLGEWSLIVLLAALAVSPLRRRLHWPALGQSRRLIGLFAFFYVTLHVLTYLGLYVQFQMTELLDDFVHRPYITAGIAAFAALFLMAMTSTQRWRRRLKQNWQRLHRLMYVAAPLAVIHLLWLSKDSSLEEAIYLLVLLLLLAERGLFNWQKRKAIR
jgi:sulfoxide reductase heme-binding subunit YedZ